MAPPAALYRSGGYRGAVTVWLKQWAARVAALGVVSVLVAPGPLVRPPARVPPPSLEADPAGDRDGARDPRLLMARANAKQGAHRQAMTLLSQVIDEAPGHRAARLQMMQAMAGAGLCGGVYTHYSAIEGTWFDGPAAQLALGACSEASGAFDDALAHYRAAAERAVMSSDTAAFVALTDLAYRLGYADEAEAALVELRVRPGGAALAAFAEARRAVRSGDPEGGLELRIYQDWFARSDLRSDATRLAVEVTAEPHFCAPWIGVLRNHLNDADVAAEMAECLRRSGDLDGAERALQRQGIQRQIDRPFPRSIAARVAVDRGDLAAAEALLAGLGDREVDVVRSRWYLAFARGPSALAAWDARWRAHPMLADRDPRDLIPTEE